MEAARSRYGRPEETSQLGWEGQELAEGYGWAFWLRLRVGGAQQVSSQSLASFFVAPPSC